MVSLYEKQVENYAHAEKSLHLVNKSSETSKSMLFLNFKTLSVCCTLSTALTQALASYNIFCGSFKKLKFGDKVSNPQTQ